MMCNLVLVFLVGLCSTSLVLADNTSGYEEKRCTLPNRSPGVCKPSSECTRSGTSSTECSTQRGTVYVCCEPTKTESPSHVGTGRTTESPRKVELNETSKTGNGTKDAEIAERFFLLDEPISTNWQNQDDRRRAQQGYDQYFRQEGRNPFRDINVDSFEIIPGHLYNLGGNKEEENRKYQWESNGRRPERPYNPGFESYEQQGRKKYPWENNQQPTARPSNPAHYYFEEREDQGYQWNPNRRTTERPHNLGFNYYEQEEQKYPWNSNRQTTPRPSNPIYNFYEENEDQKYPWNSNRRTTERPYNPGFEGNDKKEREKYPWETNRRTTVRPFNPAPNYYEEDQKYPWNSNRKTTPRPPNPAPSFYEEEDQRQPWNSNRRTTPRPFNPAPNFYEEEDQKSPWNSNRKTTPRPSNQGLNFYEEDQKEPWNSNRRTTERPSKPALNYYEEEEDQKYPWNSNRKTTPRPSNPGPSYYEEEDQRQPWNSNRRTTPRPSNPAPNFYEEEDQKYPWNSNRKTTPRPSNQGLNFYEEEQKEPWNSNRKTTPRPSNQGLNFYEEEQKEPWNSNRRTTERPRGTRRTTESPPKKQTLDPDGFVFSQNEKRKGISKIKCDEYSEIVTQTISGLPLVPDPSPIKIKVDECKNFQTLIVGGKSTSVGEFPHMAAVGFINHTSREILWKCGGSLISDRFVLTAAHCTLTSIGKPVRVRLGDYNLNREDDGAYPEDYNIAEIIVHPDYDKRVKYNDIALLRLSERVNIRKDIRPACLYTEHTIRVPTATAIGWGRLNRAGNQSEILQKVSLDIIDRKTCRKSYNTTSNIVYTNNLPRGIIETQLCAGDLSGKRDTCQGDSGGPLEILSDSNLCVHYVIGVTSFGKSCAVLNSPGVYTRVSSYIPWIESVVWPGN